MIFAKLHPLLVHFPIGLLVSGVLLEVFGTFQKEEATKVAGWFNIRLGFWCAFPVIAVGLLGVGSLRVEDKLKVFLSSHILLAGSTVCVFAAILIIYRFRTRRWVNVIYNALLAVGLFCVLATGFYGGELVHRHGVEALHISD